MTRRSNDSDSELQHGVDRRDHASIDLEEEAPQLIDDGDDLPLDDDDASPGDRRRDPLRRP